MDWKSKAVVNIYDEVSLWSAPFGRLLLENIPMKHGATVLDIGFGTGFPLIELSQRFGAPSKIYGVDIWEEGIARTKNKIDIFELENIEILTASASKIALPNESIDLVTSNLGVNNFEEREKVYAEIKRVLQADGSLCITTNPVGTFSELFDLFHSIFSDMGLLEETEKLSHYIQQRNTEAQIISEFEKAGFSLKHKKSDSTNMRFCDATAVLDHGLIRIGFRSGWENMVNEGRVDEFFGKLEERVNGVIRERGEFVMSIPMLYLEFGLEG